jgi:hypothetical protein
MFSVLLRAQGHCSSCFFGWYFYCYSHKPPLNVPSLNWTVGWTSRPITTGSHEWIENSIYMCSPESPHLSSRGEVCLVCFRLGALDLVMVSLWCRVTALGWTIMLANHFFLFKFFVWIYKSVARANTRLISNAKGSSWFWSGLNDEV